MAICRWQVLMYHFSTVLNKTGNCLAFLSSYDLGACPLCLRRPYPQYGSSRLYIKYIFSDKRLTCQLYYRRERLRNKIATEIVMTENVIHPTIFDSRPFVLFCKIFLSFAIFISMKSSGIEVTALITAVIIKA
jgi:hypothetical protein